MAEIDLEYDEIVSEIKLALKENHITEKEYKQVINALIKSKFRNDPDPRNDLNPIITKIFGEEFNSSPIKD